MSEDQNFHEGNFVHHLAKFIGETVTIFTTSGGQSGAGFTGVLLAVNHCFVRLITCIGPAPGCALGNACSDFPRGPLGGRGGNCGKNCDGHRDINTLGSVTDIPVDRIASFVHNAV